MSFSLVDGIVTVLAGILTSVLLLFFLNDLNSIAGHTNEAPLGTITFKKQTATRKSVGSQIWERLKNGALVYTADTIRTAEGSEAVVKIGSGLGLDLFENTMIRLTMKGKASSIDFHEGNMAFHGSSVQETIDLGDKAGKLTIAPGAELVLAKKANQMVLELSRGSATLQSGREPPLVLTPDRGVQMDTVAGSRQTKKIFLVPQNPIQGARALILGGRPVLANFSWLQILPEKGRHPAEVVVSSRSDFQVIEARVRGIETNSTPTQVTCSVGVPLSAGLWYWKVLQDDQQSTTRQFTLENAQAPRIQSPEDGAETRYRRVIPEIRFSWTGPETVDQWDFELAKEGSPWASAEVRRATELTSIQVPVPAGKWQWRVIPHYPVLVIGPPPSPPVGRILVREQLPSSPITFVFPVEGMAFPTQEVATQGLSFTWDPVAEAVGYELTVAKGQGPVLGHFATATPYITVPKRDLTKVAGEGNWSWSLFWIDEKGVRSPQGPRRTIRTIDATEALRATFPPPEYRIYEPFLPNTQFAWKANVGLKTVFQVSRSPTFDPILFETTADSTAKGRSWGQGVLYWRVLAFNANGSVFLRTQPRRFTVVGPFPEVTEVEPRGPVTSIALEPEKLTVHWAPLPGADTYLFSVSSQGASEEPLFQGTFTGKDQDFPVLPVSAWKEGDYRLMIQALAVDTPLSTAVTGRRTLVPLTLRHLNRIHLVSPKSGATFPGLQTRLEGLPLRWEVPHPDLLMVLEVHSRGQKKPLLVRPMGHQNQTTLTLPPGTYDWTVRGTLEGLDLSASQGRRLEVASIPRLPKVTVLGPRDKSVVGPEDFQGPHSLDFRWAPVSNANRYWFRVLAEGEPRPRFEALLTEPHRRIDKLSALGRGTFFWEVEAQVVDPSGVVIQHGTPVRQTFSIEVPSVWAPQLSDQTTFYGR